MHFDGYIFESEIAQDKAHAIERLCDRLYADGRIADLNAFKAAVQAREAEASTELAPHVFAPHAKSKTVVKPSVAVMKTKQNESVFLIASNTDNGHIKALAELARRLSE